MRNYTRFILAAGTQGGAAASTVARNWDELNLFLSSLDPQSLVYDPIPVYFGLDQYALQVWIQRAIGSEIYTPQSDVEPVIFLDSPRGRGEFEWSGGTITF